MDFAEIDEKIFNKIPNLLTHFAIRKNSICFKKEVQQQIVEEIRNDILHSMLENWKYEDKLKELKNKFLG